MKILVTGFKGFIGGQLFKYFGDSGYEVDGVDWEKGVLPDVKNYQWVIHCGAISDTTERDVNKVLKQNYDFTVKLLKVCNEHKTNIQLASTSAVYGPNKSFNENDPVYPQTPYAWSKYLVDKLLIDKIIKSYDIIVQSFRYFNVYGPGESHKGNQQSMISKFQEQARIDGEIKLFKNSNLYERDLICVFDLCKVHEQMINKKISGIFNLGTGKTTNLEKIAKLIASLSSTKIRYIEMPENLKGQYQKYTCADISKLNRFVSIENWTKVEEYLEHIFKEKHKNNLI